jgi:hypothetical protein
MRHRSTHTLAELEISPQAFDEIAGLLRAADYGHVFLEDGRLLDMTGIGLTRGTAPPSARLSRDSGNAVLEGPL